MPKTAVFLIELTKMLSNFFDCIGGIKYISEFLNLFEVILNIDEPNIKKEAINSLKILLEQIGDIKEIEKDLMEIINKFYNGEDINQKLNAIDLIILVYKGLNENNKKILLNYLENFSSSDNLIIKKELINEIKKISTYLNIDYLKNIMIKMMNDDNESIKIDIINLIVSLKEHKNLEIIMDYIEEIIQKLSEDTNVKVRLAIINNLSEILTFPKINYNFKQQALNIYIKLIEDKEEQIRNACCLKLEEITKILKNEINYNKLLQNLNILAKDEKTFVRSNLSENLYKICLLLNKKQLNEFIFPIFNELISDENLDIRINIISNIMELSENIEINNNIIEKIIPSIKEIAQNKSWRVRNKIINIIPLFANQKIFMKDIFPICLNYLTDHVYAIRDEGCKLLSDLYKDIRNIEFENKLIEKLDSMSNLTNYLFRNTCLIFIKYFIDKISNKNYFDFFQNKLIFFVFKLSDDKISNVRMTCALIFNKIKKYNFTDRNKNEKIKNSIDKLKKDEDNDVIRIFD